MLLAEAEHLHTQQRLENELETLRDELRSARTERDKAEALRQAAERERMDSVRSIDELRAGVDRQRAASVEEIEQLRRESADETQAIIARLRRESVEEIQATIASGQAEKAAALAAQQAQHEETLRATTMKRVVARLQHGQLRRSWLTWLVAAQMRQRQEAEEAFQDAAAKMR